MMVSWQSGLLSTFKTTTTLWNKNRESKRDEIGTKEWRCKPSEIDKAKKMDH